MGAHDPVTNLANLVLGGQFDRAAPDHNFPVADIDVPPAGGAPFGGYIVTDPFIADEENQWFSGGPAGVEARKVLRLFGLEAFQIAADDRLGQEGDTLQISQ